VVGTKYKSGDYLPYIYKTENYGKTWRQITNGIGAEDFTRALRADPKRKGLLYAGTERGMYISFDDGSNWNKFQLNLPIVPITDLAIKNDNLIAATQGRSFWMIDDLTPMHQLTTSLVQEDVILFKPQDSYRMGGGNGRTSKTEGTNHPGGVAINYFIKEKDAKEPVSLQIYDSNDALIKTFSTNPNKEKKEAKLTLENGNNIFYWDMMYPGAEKVKGMILWWASLNGPMALPGNYKVTLTMGETSKSQNFTILKNPISETTLADATAQFDFINDINTKVTEIHKALKNVKKVRAQVTALQTSIKNKEKHSELLDYAASLLKEMTIIEETLYQTKSKSGQDPLNFPIRLNNKLAHLNSLTRIGSYAPTQQAIDFKNEINKEIDKELSKLYDLFNNKVTVLNKKVKDSQIDLIQLD
jgi:hypothetical protein